MSGSSSSTSTLAWAPRPTVVLALGNPLRGDDGAGPAVLEMLAAAGVPDDVELIDGGLAGLETTLHLQHRSRAIILDAADLGERPGAWRRVAYGDLHLPSFEAGRGLHSAGLREALLLGEALGILPAEISLYLIQPHDIDWVEGLSDDVRASLDRVCQAVRSELGDRQPAAVQPTVR